MRPTKGDVITSRCIRKPRACRPMHEPIAIDMSRDVGFGGPRPRSGSALEPDADWRRSIDRGALGCARKVFVRDCWAAREPATGDVAPIKGQSSEPG